MVNNSSGVLYFNRGTQCIPRLLVSARSLRKHYKGNASIVCEEESLPEAWCLNQLAELKIDVIKVPMGHQNILVAKSRIWKHSPYGHTMFIDSDTLIVGSIDQFFEMIKEHGLVVTNFNNWGTSHGRMYRRIIQWEPIAKDLVEKAVKYGKAINTGVFGWKAGNPAMIDYQELTLLGFQAKPRVHRKILDETAMQLVITKHKHTLTGPEWNVSGLYGEKMEQKILHFHGHKHCRDSETCAKWKAGYLDLIDSIKSIPGALEALGQGGLDRTISLWLKTTNRRRRDLTIVTAVNPKYVDRARKNFKRWMSTPGLKDQRFLVFVNGFEDIKSRRFLNHPNVKVVRWQYGFDDANDRETMLASFILGVAAQVRTKYWMKLDFDATPKRKWFEFPAYEGKTIVSHRWGFTKLKGEENIKRHWFHRLDDLFSPKKPFFKREYDPVKDFKVRHGGRSQDKLPMRFGSFCHIEKTEFTKRIANHIEVDGSGRLPIPSQDTISWYCSSLWNEAVELVNMKKWFKP